MALSSLLFFLAAVAAVYGGVSQPCENPDAEVLILGAGMSGISAARTLYENGVTDFIILEQARNILYDFWPILNRSNQPGMPQWQTTALLCLSGLYIVQT